MKFDLDTMSRQDLITLRADIDKALDRLAAKEKKLALQAAEQAARAYGFSLAELTASDTGKAPKPARPAKYRNPADASQTWSGVGRQPGWVKTALAAGKSLSDLAI